MAELSKDWGDCIKDLLARHGLTYRGAMLKAGGKPSHTTIKDWADGILPSRLDLALHFLSAFPVEEAVPCLHAARIPVPPEWGGEHTERDIVHAASEALAKQLKERFPELAASEREEVRKAVVETMHEMLRGNR